MNHSGKRVGADGQEYCEPVPVCRDQQGNNKSFFICGKDNGAIQYDTDCQHGNMIM